jgi:hypothetical protein
LAEAISTKTAVVESGQSIVGIVVILPLCVFVLSFSVGVYRRRIVDPVIARESGAWLLPDATSSLDKIAAFRLGRLPALLALLILAVSTS